MADCEFCTEGLVECDVCNGTGVRDVDDETEEKCQECDGSGETECWECSGTGEGHDED